MISAGLDGIKNKIKPPAPIEKNLYAMCETELEKERVPLLPRSLVEALDEMEKSTMAKHVLSEFLFNRFIELKRIEAQEYGRYFHTEYL
jgi:glutamine synthetase